MVEDALSDRLALFELSSQEAKGFSDWFANIYSASLRRASARQSTKTSDEIIDSRNLANDDLGEVVSKFFVIVPLG